MNSILTHLAKTFGVGAFALIGLFGFSDYQQSNIKTLRKQPASWDSPGITVDRDAQGQPTAHLPEGLEAVCNVMMTETGQVRVKPGMKLVHGFGEGNQEFFWAQDEKGKIIKVAVR